MYTHSLETQVENMIRTHFNISPTDPEFDREVDLFDRGYVDSMGIVELLELLQEEFKVEFSDKDLLSDDFSSISGIAWLVSRNSQHESL